MSARMYWGLASCMQSICHTSYPSCCNRDTSGRPRLPRLPVTKTLFITGTSFFFDHASALDYNGIIIQVFAVLTSWNESGCPQFARIEKRILDEYFFAFTH